MNYHEIHSNPMKLAFDEKKDMDVGLEGLVGKSALCFTCHKIKGESLPCLTTCSQR